MFIAPVIIACKERYVKVATISVPSFLKHHNMPLFVLTDDLGMKELGNIKDENLKLIHIHKYLKSVYNSYKIPGFSHYDYEKKGDYSRKFAALKPLLMEAVVSDLAPEASYILSLDSDSYFSGNIMNTVKKEIKKDRKDLYMVERTDKRMLRMKTGQPGSGFTLWNRKSKFLKLFRKGCEAGKCINGSQNLILNLLGAVNSRIIKNPMLHFVSPDLNNPNFPESEIKKLKPAYIHLHGKNSYNRLKRFKKIIG